MELKGTYYIFSRWQIFSKPCYIALFVPNSIHHNQAACFICHCVSKQANRRAVRNGQIATLFDFNSGEHFKHIFTLHQHVQYSLNPSLQWILRILMSESQPTSCSQRFYRVFVFTFSDTFPLKYAKYIFIVINQVINKPYG